MKIRSGFVSNSSSSSFICRLKDITEDEIKLLKKYGFQYDGNYFSSQTYHAGPSSEQISEENIQFLSAIIDGIDPVNLRNAPCLSFSVACNQDDVMKFLTDNNIPFEGTVHYGHYNVFFKRGEKFVMQVANAGMIREMYGEVLNEHENFVLEGRNWDYNPFTFIPLKSLE